MTKLELRCDRHLHMRLDPERIAVSVKCAQCTREAGRPVFHTWPLAEIIERYRNGDLNGVCAPKEEFVFWKVLAA